MKFDGFDYFDPKAIQTNQELQSIPSRQIFSEATPAIPSLGIS